MGQALRPGGLYYLQDGTAVDANGNKIDDAPEREPDTPDDEIVTRGMSPEERAIMAIREVITGTAGIGGNVPAPVPPVPKKPKN
jgi:hypothetical protein